MADTSLFVAQFARHSQRVYSYILTLVANVEDADEVYQDTSAIAWQKFAEFEEGTNFGAWICKIAYHRAMKLHEKRAGDPHVFDGELLSLIAATHDRESDTLVERRAALAACVDQLPAADQHLLRRRYTGEAPHAIAESIGKSANAVYKTLYRLHRALLKCVNRHLGSEVAP